MAKVTESVFVGANCHNAPTKSTFKLSGFRCQLIGLN